MATKVGVIGAGGMLQYHAAGFKQAGAEIVAIADADLREGVEARAGVIPDVALGMPFRILRHADHRVEFRVELRPTAGLQDIQADRRLAAAEQELRPLLHQAFGRQVDLGERGTEGDGLRGDREFEARGELHRTEHAERVFGELIGDVAKTLSLKIGDAAPRVDHLARERVPHDRVEREVTAFRGVLRRHRRVGLHVEIRVLGARAVLTAGHRDVDREVLELRHAEGRADRDDAEFLAQGRFDLARAEAVDLDVDVEDGHAHQRVAHAAADEAGAVGPALRLKGVEHRRRLRRGDPGQLHRHGQEQRVAIEGIRTELGHGLIEQGIQLGGFAGRGVAGKSKRRRRHGQAGGDGGKQHLATSLQGETPKERFVGRMPKPCPGPA